MLRQIFTVLITLAVAIGILGTSLLRASSVDYSFSDVLSVSNDVDIKRSVVDYDMPYPEDILPDHPFWPVIAASDRVRTYLTFEAKDRVTFNQQLADRRLVASKKLFEEGKPEEGFSTLTKAEKYLGKTLDLIKEAEKRGVEVDELLQIHARAALKHQEEVGEIIQLAPEDAKPEVAKVQNFSINAYKETRDALNERGLPVPENPFESE